MQVAQAKGLPSLKYHLLPRTKGFTITVRSLRNVGKEDPGLPYPGLPTAQGKPNPAPLTQKLLGSASQPSVAGSQEGQRGQDGTYTPVSQIQAPGISSVAAVCSHTLAHTGAQTHARAHTHARLASTALCCSAPVLQGCGDWVEPQVIT